MLPDSPEGNARTGISVSPEASAPSPLLVPADPARLPDLVLPATDGRAVGLGALGPGRTVLYVYPL